MSPVSVNTVVRVSRIGIFDARALQSGHGPPVLMHDRIDNKCDYERQR
jgi:hypothetical protein